MLRPRSAVVVAPHHRLEDLEHRRGADDAGVVRAAALVASRARTAPRRRRSRRDRCARRSRRRCARSRPWRPTRGSGHERDVTVRAMTIGVTRVFHLNVNCSDLERSLALLPRPARAHAGRAHGVRPSRTARAFGLDPRAVGRVDPPRRRGYDGVVLDLLEWQMPRPIGAPTSATGDRSASAASASPRSDVDALHARLVDGGRRTASARRTTSTSRARRAMRAFTCLDPDGTMVELVVEAGDRRPVLRSSRSTARDLDRSIDFYARCSGFSPLARFAPGPQDGAALGVDGEIELEMAYLDDPRARRRVRARPRAVAHAGVGRRRRHAQANRLGPFRLALYTDDIDARPRGARRRKVCTAGALRPSSRWAPASRPCARCCSTTPTAPCSSSSSRPTRLMRPSASRYGSRDAGEVRSALALFTGVRICIPPPSTTSPSEAPKAANAGDDMCASNAAWSS